MFCIALFGGNETVPDVTLKVMFELSIPETEFSLQCAVTRPSNPTLLNTLKMKLQRLTISLQNLKYLAWRTIFKVSVFSYSSELR